MKEKITLPTLVATIALASGKSKKQCEDFLRELLNVLEQTLQTGETIKIKNLGTFKVIAVDSRRSIDVNTGEEIEIPGHNKISFIPSKELAERINSPFDFFESVEIQEEVSSEDEDTSQAPLLEENYESPVIINNEEEPSETHEEEIEEVENQDKITMSKEEKVYPKRNYNFFWGLLCGAIIYIILQCCLSNFFNLNIDNCINNFTSNLLNTKASSDQQTDNMKPSTPEETGIILKDSMNNNTSNAETGVVVSKSDEVPTKASDQVIIDTISRTRFLTTMAKEHYGNFNLWPYIYIENQEKLGHPDRIKPGTTVVVPPLSKYNIDPENKTDIENAKKKGLEIYRKFQKQSQNVDDELWRLLQ